MRCTARQRVVGVCQKCLGAGKRVACCQCPLGWTLEGGHPIDHKFCGTQVVAVQQVVPECSRKLLAGSRLMRARATTCQLAAEA